LVLSTAKASALTFTNYTTTNGLGSNNVNGVYADSGSIYAATDSGLSISTNGGTSWTNYTTTNGLGNNTVRGVYADSGSIYAATFGGGLSIAPNPVPGPLPLLGAGAAFSWSRRLRRRLRATQRPHHAGLQA
jgi:hypothetical protein